MLCNDRIERLIGTGFFILKLCTSLQQLILARAWRSSRDFEKSFLIAHRNHERNLHAENLDFLRFGIVDIQD